LKRNRTLDLLRRFESRNVTYLEQDGSWPIVWRKARGVHVWDDGGRKYLDLTAAFGVAAAGHANPRVVRAAEKQMRQLLHAMGDVHPHERKAELARELSRITFERWQAGGAKTIFCNSGFEAVEAAFKTAFLATGRSKVIAFEGGYHGLGYGALNATHRTHFRSPFRSQLAEFATFVPFPESEAALPKVVERMEELARSSEFGAILIEPIQARGGMRVPPNSFLPSLQRIAHANGMLLILDEIYTGFGRSGRWFACEHSQAIPDLICLGKALTGGFPLSACVGKADLMDAAWPSSMGEAIHTSTFLGHPVGCAMALANIKEISRLYLPAAARTKGRALNSALKQISSPRFTLRAKGLGLMIGLEIVDQDDNPATDAVLRIIKNLLHGGFIFLPEGEFSNVISFTPPLIITEAQLHTSVSALRGEIESL
jgi:4-aminobutyrate aminotransferase-like enzyme